MYKQAEKRFKKFSKIEKYSYLAKLRDLLKDIQKLSWKITQFDRKFPLEEVSEKQYQDLLKTYFDYYLEIQDISHFFKKEIH